MQEFHNPINEGSVSYAENIMADNSKNNPGKP